MVGEGISLECNSKVIQQIYPFEIIIESVVLYLRDGVYV